MELQSCPAPIMIEDSCLKGWKVIGAGGFGQIYKARHCNWGCDVAIKLLHFDDGKGEALLREIDMMRQGSSPYVIQVRGVFKGRVPTSGLSTQLGLVMEFMERGSLASLQETLGGALLWPLVFRLAHQVALGINFLHSLSPPLLHLDLKPSNVLLDSYLNAKLTDFGLARFYHSVRRVSRGDSEEEGGTINYMPPEAFQTKYKPTKASDIYSYGILLWSIVTGKQPYACAKSSLVRIRIPEGDRPPLDNIRSQVAGLAGLTGLIDLMERCWVTKPKERPSALECTTEAEELFKMHKPAIHEAVHQVMKQLDQREEEKMTEQVERVQITQAAVPERFAGVTVCDGAQTRGPPIQEMSGRWPTNQRDPTKMKEPPSYRPANVCYGDVSRPASGYKEKKSSVCPIRSLPPSPSAGRSSQSKPQAKTSQLDFRKHLSTQYHRQHSSPDMLPSHPAPANAVHFHFSNVTGLQQGDNNTMHIQICDPRDRKRHPTAPPSLNLPPSCSGSWRDKTGGTG